MTRGSRPVVACWTQSHVHDNELRQALFELDAVLGVPEDVQETMTTLARKLTD